MSTDHFQGQYEVELKFRLASKSAFLQRLHQLPHEIMLEDNQETDLYFDTPTHQLQLENKHLCIRTMQPSGIKLWIVKGPAADECQATRIDDHLNAAEMLKKLGYQVVLTLSKRRSIYFIGEYHITLDHLDGLGDFAELAIMTDDQGKLATYHEALWKLAATLGLDISQQETASYRTLMEKQTKNNR